MLAEFDKLTAEYDFKVLNANCPIEEIFEGAKNLISNFLNK